LRPASETDGQDNGEPSRLITEWAFLLCEPGPGGRPGITRAKGLQCLRQGPTLDTASALGRVGAVAAWAFPVAGIRRTENLLQSGVSVVTSPGTTHQNVATYVASVAAVGQTVTTYQNIADALVTFLRDTS
jgi:hypothetical protein